MSRFYPISFQASPEKLNPQDLPEGAVNPVDFFADYSDRLLVSRWVSERSDSFQSASYLMIPSQNEIEACAPLLAISVNASDELSGEPRKYQTKQPFNRNTIGRAVELGKQEAIDCFTRPKKCGAARSQSIVPYLAFKGIDLHS